MGIRPRVGGGRTQPRQGRPRAQYRAGCGWMVGCGRVSGRGRVKIGLRVGVGWDTTCCRKRPSSRLAQGGLWVGRSDFGFVWVNWAITWV